MSRLEKQLNFFFTSDLLKSVTRQNRINNGSRDENVAEHSWQLTLMALLFAEYAPEGTDLAHVVKLLIVHDLVEIYAGDTMVLTDEEASATAEREQKAGEKLFGLLPDDQKLSFWTLWREFEERETAEAKFAKAIDALQPPLMTWGEGGKGSDHHNLTAQMALERKRPYLENYPELWQVLEKTLSEAVENGILKAQ